MSIDLQLIGRFDTGVFDEGAAEIVAYDPATERLLVVNADANRVDVLDISDPSDPTLFTTLELADAVSFEGSLNSVSFQNGLGAAAVSNETDETQAGAVVFFNVEGDILNTVSVGVLPDNVQLSADASIAVVANEAEQVDDVDPEGSISIINLQNGPENASVNTLPLSIFNGQEDALRAEGVRIVPGKTAAEDFEPEYVAISPDGTEARVSLQENNALVVVDLVNQVIVDVQGLGTVDFSAPGAGIDPNDSDGVNIRNVPVFGLFQPDTIAAYEVDGETFYVSANEGDLRDPEITDADDFAAEVNLDPSALAALEAGNLEDLELSNVDGDIDGDGDIDQLVAGGARSFGIWDADGQLIFNSGDDLETITSIRHPDDFNSTNDENDSFENRSDDAGPEPEGLALGQVDGVDYAFVGLERIGGIAVYDISDPINAEFVTYVNTRNFNVPVLLDDGTVNPEVGDLAPEGLVFISAEDSPNGAPLLIVGNEVSGTTAIFQVTDYGLFDADFYLNINRDVASDGRDPLEHYNTIGASEGRDPNLLFDTEFYLTQRPDAADNPLQDYVDAGAAAGANPNQFFDSAAYLAGNPDVTINPLLHYILEGEDAIIAGTQSTAGVAFDAGFYLAQNPDVVEGIERGFFPNALAHYITFGAAEGRDAGLSNQVSIGTIQGAGHVSPLVGREVVTNGVVTAVDSNGFFLQDPIGDGDDFTSDGIFVFTGDTPTVAQGNAIVITATVSEFIPGGAGTGNLSITQLGSVSSIDVSDVVAAVFPTAVTLGQTGRAIPSETVISEDELTNGQINLQQRDSDIRNVFDPNEDGIDFYESLEGMLVTIPNPVVIGGTTRFGETWVLADAGAGVAAADRTDAGGLLLTGVDADGTGDLNPEKIQIDPDSTVSPNDVNFTTGDVIGDVTGVVSYAFGAFEVVPTTELVAPEAAFQQEVTTLAASDDQLSVVAYNVFNLSADSSDDEQRARIAQQIVDNLGSPDILALQEIQDDNGTASETDDGVLTAEQGLQLLVDAIVAAGGPTYAFESAVVDEFNENGGAPGSNIRNAFLYNAGRVDLVEVTTLESDVLEGFGVTNPFAFDGSRDPLLGVFSFQGEEITLINNHFSSRFGSTPIDGGPQPFVQAGEDERFEQARANNEVVDALLAENPDARVAVLGDLNTFEFTDELTETLPGSGAEQVLTNLVVEAVDPGDRYTFIFNGNSQILDSIFATDALLTNVQADIVHVNIDFPANGDLWASDHDPVVALFDFSDALIG